MIIYKEAEDGTITEKVDLNNSSPITIKIKDLVVTYYIVGRTLAHDLQLWPLQSLNGAHKLYVDDDILYIDWGLHYTHQPSN